MTKGVAALRRQLTLVPAVEFLQHMPADGGGLPLGISRLTDEIETKFQRLPPFSGSSFSMKLLRALLDETGS